MLTAAQLKELDDKRKRREDELILLLLLLLGWSVEQVFAFVGTAGELAAESLRVVGQALGEHGVREIAETMADAHLDAFEVYEASLAKVPAKDELVSDYEAVAKDMKDAMVDAIRKQFDAGAKTLAEALLAAKYSQSSHQNIAVGAERNIVTASNAGLFNGAVVRFGVGGITGLRHRSVLDDATSAQCKERDGLQLPVLDPYFLRNYPSLHSGCRSVLVPLVGPFEASNWRPQTPPELGYGRMPEPVRRLLRSLASAA